MYPNLSCGFLHICHRKMVISQLLQLAYKFNFNYHRESMTSLFKTKASTLVKVSALTVYRSPKDLYNKFTEPMDLQKKQIDGELGWKEGKYFSNFHYNLVHSVGASRKQYRSVVEATAREAIARKEYASWKNYLKGSIKNPQAQLNQQQKQQIYEAMMTAKERNEQRLALNRFIKFGYEYSQAFKVDLPLNPIVIMKLVHPHFGYLNNFPNLNEYKFTHEQLFTLIEEFNAVSLIRDKGYILHSSQLLSFIFWKILSINKARVSTSDFINLLKVFKFKDVTQENLKEKISYSLKEGEIIEGDDNVRFDTFRQIFLDRQL